MTNNRHRLNFRIWNEENKSMYDCQQLTPWALDPAQDKLQGVFIPFKDNYKIMQCIGDWDSKNNLIYEGDILSFFDEEGNEGLCEVVFDEEDLQFQFLFKGNYYRPYEIELSECKIVGNIYASPGLLK